MSRVDSLLRLCRYGFSFQRPIAPLMVVFAVTTRCDMQCRHCGDDVWGDPSNDLSLEAIEKFSQSLGNCKDLAIGGGEPFLRRDLEEICALFIRNNGVKNLGIATNGFATDRICSTVERIITKWPATNLGLSISLDGFQSTHDNIRMPGSYERVMESARRFCTLREKYKNFSFFFNATINNVNWRELPDLAAHVHDRFQTFLDFNLLTGNPRDSFLTLPAPDEIKTAIDGIYSARKSCQLPVSLFNVYRDTLLRTNSEARQVVPCRAGSLIVLVEANGDVRVCPQFPVLGNLHSQSFQDIWWSHTAKMQYRSIRRGGCTCNDSCYVISSLNHYWKTPFMMIRQGLNNVISRNR